MKKDLDSPLVSIACITFNHGPYIRQCLDGMVRQVTAFPFEIVLYDDASTDETKEIVEEYARKHPKLFNILFQERNQYSQGVRCINARFNLPRCKGKYVAICEGDDYWTDPQKLQKQVDFLEANPEYSLCFHHVAILMPDHELKDDFITHVPSSESSIETIARQGNFIHTPSILFRNVIGSYPPALFNAPLGDVALQMLLAEKGKFMLIPQLMAVYRYGVGIWSSTDLSRQLLHGAKTHLIMASYFLEKENKSIADIFLERVARFVAESACQCVPEDLRYLLEDFVYANDLIRHLVPALSSKNKMIEDLKGVVARMNRG